MGEIVIVRDPEHAGRWHLRLIDDEDIGLTMCADGDGWQMKPWLYESEPLLFEMGCRDCMLMLAETVKMDQDRERMERDILYRAEHPHRHGALRRVDLDYREKQIASDLVKRGLLEQLVWKMREGNRIVFRKKEKEQSV